MEKLKEFLCIQPELKENKSRRTPITFSRHAESFFYYRQQRNWVLQ